MKRFLWGAVCLLWVGSAIASSTVTVGRVPGTYFTPGWGGEYQLAPLGVSGIADSSFQSFCVQMDARVTAIPETTYSVTVNDRVMDSGVVLRPEVAYLYTQFRNGTLEGYDYTLGAAREASSRALQAAIWYLQGESDDIEMLLRPTGSGWEPASASDVALADEFVAVALSSGWTSIGSARVLNLSSEGEEATCDNQDMLGLVVPAPGAMVLGSLGLGVLGWLRRRPAS